MPKTTAGHQALYLIDDSPVDAEMIARVIRKAGWPLAFHWIGDAEEGLATLRNWTGNDRDIILLDIKMPKLSGLEILERLHADRVLKRLPPITVLSSSTLGADTEKATSFPGVRYVTKPAGYLDLKILLHQLLPDQLKKH